MQSKSGNTYGLLLNIICVIIGTSSVIYNNYTTSNNNLDSVVIGNTYEVLDIRDDNTYNNISIVLKDTTTEDRIYYEYNGKNYG